MIIAVPTGIKILSWVSTMFGCSIVLNKLTSFNSRVKRNSLITCNCYVNNINKKCTRHHRDTTP
jgi:heme/copper-type cytochrome/quinol oxidase subunit 1